MYSFTADDAFIFFRYAENLALHHRYSFNLSGEPIEGVTSVLWAFLMAGVRVFSPHLELAAKTIGLIAMGGVFVLTYVETYRRCAVATDRGERTFYSALSVFLLSSFAACAVHAVSGMETSLFTFLILAAVLCASQKNHLLSAVVYLLLALTRPEANGIALLCLLSARPPKQSLRPYLLFFILPAAVYFFARWGWSGNFFPLPYYVKAASPGGMPGKAQVFRFLYTVFGTLPLGLLIGAGAFSEARRGWLILAVAASLPALYLFAEPMMGYSWRHVFPVLPLLLILASLGLCNLTSRIKGPKLRRAFPLVFAAGLVLSVFSGKIATASARQTASLQTYAVQLRAVYFPLAEKLAALREPNSLLALTDAGVLPFFSRWETVDVLGLNHNGIARAPANRLQFVFERPPDILILISRHPNVFQARFPWETGLYEHALTLGMRRVTVAAFNDTYQLWVMAYPGTRYFAALGAR